MKNTIIGLLFVVVCVVGGLFGTGSFKGCRTDDSKRSSPVSEISVSGAPKTSSRTPEKPDSRRTVQFVVAICIFAVLDFSVFWGAKHFSIDPICKDSSLSNQVKLRKIENEDVWFDVPLYLGLLGTVLGFLFIAWEVPVGRDVAYVSTVEGIIASALMRLFWLRPCRRRLLDESVKEQG